MVLIWILVKGRCSLGLVKDGRRSLCCMLVYREEKTIRVIAAMMSSLLRIGTWIAGRGEFA